MRIKQMILFCLLVLFTVLFAQEKQAKLAVMEIEDKSGKLSKALLENAAEALRTEIGATNKFVLISKDRQRKAMIKGQKKESWKECYDQSCRIELGQALTADRILTGIVTYFGKKYILTAELIDLAKEATVKTAKAEFDGTEVGLSEAISSIATQIAGVRKAGSAFQTGKTGEKVEEWEIGQGEETIVKFDSKPGEAVVIVDGKILCQKTPCSKMLTQGKHEITIQKENFLPKTKVFDIVKGRPPLIAELEPDFGYLSVASEPEGIEVLLDGKNIGKTPVEKVVLSPGAHQVETNDSCYYQTGEKFTTKRGESKSIRLDIKPKESGIKVTAQDKEGNDLEADILVDGKNIGTAPGTYKVPLCAKELVVQTKGLVYKEVLALKEKQTKSISVILKRKERYEARGDVVIDEKTGLMWQRGEAPQTENSSNAREYCGKLALGGYDDWRLPSISELKTLIVGCQSGTDACGVDNFHTSSRSYRGKGCYCPEGQGPGEKGYYWQKGVWQGKQDFFWSSTKEPDYSNAVWGIYFPSGSVGDTSSDHGGVRCVRGQANEREENVPIKVMSNEIRDASGFEIKGKEIAIDNKTGLMWTRGDRRGIYQYRAIEYCQNLSLDDYDDWRLPSISELKTLIVGCQSGTDACPVSDSSLARRDCWSDACSCEFRKAAERSASYYLPIDVFPGAHGGLGCFWSSSKPSDLPDFGWYVEFDCGCILADYTSTLQCNFACVRGEMKKK